MDVMEKSRRAHFLFDDQTPKQTGAGNDQHNRDDGSGGVVCDCVWCFGGGKPQANKSSSTAKDVVVARPAGSNRT
uniref:Uncharacterized protein n=1 Tax=Oryza punctata TaxID=4537 RepID=A0A0E0KY46_ORYPU